MKVKYAMLLGALAFALLAYGCGGGGTPAEEENGGTELNSLSDIPDNLLNPQEYDLTTRTTALAMVASKGFKAQGAEGGFSRAGCETDRMKKNIMRNAVMPRMVLCYIQAFETAADMTAAGEGTFNYWKGDTAMAEQVEGPSEVAEFKPRMAIKKDGNTLTFVMCNDTTKSMELVIGEEGGIYSGHVIDIWSEGMKHSMEFEADGTPEDFTTASFTQSFIESGDWNGFGSESLSAVNNSETDRYNVVQGFYNQSGDMTFAGAVYAMFDASQGTAKYRADEGSYPAQTITQIWQGCVNYNGEENCGTLENWLDPAMGWLNNPEMCGGSGPFTENSYACFPQCAEGEEMCCPTLADEGGSCEMTPGQGDTQSFAIDNTDPLNLIFTVAASSAYAADVEAASPPDSSEEPVIEFTSASADVDCSGSDSWTDLEFTAPPDVTDCQAMEAEMNNWDTGDLCQQLDDEANTGS